MKAFLCIIVLLLGIIIFAEDNILPPSRYIGIFTNWKQYKNGEIPFSDAGGGEYTGEWTYKNNLTHIEGQYYKGIPSGTWIAYRRNNMPYIVASYADASYSMTVYYPDGLVSLQEIGDLIVTPDLFEQKPKELKRWDILGVPYKSYNTASMTGWLWFNGVDNGSRSFNLGEYLIDCYYFIISPSTLQVAFYISKGGPVVGKVVYQGVIDNATGKIAVSKVLNYGTFNVKIYLSLYKSERIPSYAQDGDVPDTSNPIEAMVKFDAGGSNHLDVKLWSLYIFDKK